jgi:hypothetical protein
VGFEKIAAIDMMLLITITRWMGKYARWHEDVKTMGKWSKKSIIRTK